MSDWSKYHEYLTPQEKEQVDKLLLTVPAHRLFYHDPLGFARHCLDCRLAPHQTDILEQLPNNKRISLRGPHGLGKTALMAVIILWFAITRDMAGIDWKIPTTASVWRQLSNFLWPEIHKWSRGLKWERIGRKPFNKFELLTLNLKLRHGEAFALASDNPADIEGAHASAILYVCDEAKTIPAGTWQAVEGAMSSGDARMIAFSTPGEPAGTFYDIHSRKAGFEDWLVRHVTLDECITSGRVSLEWADQRKLQWGEKSAVYQNRVLGEFADNSDDGVIPLSWVEAANERWQEHEDRNDWGEPIALGCDIADQGEDKTVFAMLYPGGVRNLQVNSKIDTMESTGKIMRLLTGRDIPAIVDVIGLGAGVVSRLRELGANAVAFNAGASATGSDISGELGFANRRAEGWWRLRELLDPSAGATLALPPIPELIGDLTAPTHKATSAGKILIESKDDIRKRLGRSTDYGDAVVMAVSGLRAATYDDLFYIP